MQSLFYVDVELILNVIIYIYIVNENMIISFMLPIQSKLFYVDAFPKCMVEHTFWEYKSNKKIWPSKLLMSPQLSFL